MTQRHAREDGFTLVELLIAMVLGAMVLAIIIAMIVNVFGSSNRTSARSKAQRSAVAAAELLTSDLRAAEAPERSPKFVGSPDNYRAILLNKSNPGNVLAHDVLAATPTNLVFYAELVRTSPREECVQWAIQPDGSLRRSVFRFSANCTALTGPLQSAVVMPARSTGAAASTTVTPFRYRLLVQPQPNAAIVNPDLCAGSRPPATWSASPANWLPLDQIVGVDLDLRSFVVLRGGRGDQELNTSVSIPSRQSIEYRYAIGCSA